MGGKGTLAPELFRETSRALRQAAASGVGDSGIKPGKDFLSQLSHSADVFSAFKTHSQQSAMVAALKDSDGKLRSFSQFRKATEPITGKYNRAWLKTEYSTAISRAHHAANWQQYQDEKDVLPCLQWVESTAAVPGDDHRIFWGTIQPVDSPFWASHSPGDRWNCQCSLEQTDKAPTIAPQADSRSMPQKGLDNNTGRDGKLFNESHPYFPNSCMACPFVSNKLSALYHNLADNRDCHNCNAINSAINKTKIADKKAEFDAITGNVEKTFFDKNSGGYVITDNDRIDAAKKSKNEMEKYVKEKAMCINFAKDGNIIRHLGEFAGVSSADTLCNGLRADLKATASHNNIVKYAKKAIYKQDSEIVLFEFENFNSDFIAEINKLKNNNIHGMYYIKGESSKIIKF